MFNLDAFFSTSAGNYPPYNIYRKAEDYTVEVGVSGFSKDDLAVDFDGKILKVSGKREKNTSLGDMVYCSLAQRNFNLDIAVRGQFEVGEVYLKDGSLFIEMKDVAERVKPVIKVRK